MITLPANLASLAKLASSDALRFATNALLVQEIDGSMYQIQVTDHKRLAVATGPVARDSDGDQEDDGTGTFQALIPVAGWTRAMKMATRRDEVRVVLGEQTSRFWCGTSQMEVTNADGKFPPAQEVIKTLYSMFRVRVDAKLLAELLLVAAAFAPDGHPAVILHFGRRDHPFVITTGNESGQQFQACIMPLT